MTTALLPRQPTPPLPPTLVSIAAFLGSFFPERNRDTPFFYHTPRGNVPASTPISNVVLSITPTTGVYSLLHQRSASPPLAFLHRPFTLERHKLPKKATVLSCHKGFDEVLTVGYNTILAARLGMDIDRNVCLQGYKGDRERRIGIVGPVNASVIDVLQRIRAEFGEWEGVYGTECHVQSDAGSQGTVKALAIMNAFHGEEVERVAQAAVEQGWAQDAAACLYLTGQAREPGLEAAMAKGMKVVCVGHRICEEWGIKYLASRLREEYPMLQVEEVFEDEEPPIKPFQSKGEIKKSAPD